MLDVSQRLIVLDPVGETKKELQTGSLAPRLSDLNRKVVSLLDDGFAGSSFYVKGLQERLSKTFPNTQFLYYVKPNLSRPAPPPMFQEVVQKSDAVIVGIAA